jgi:hypothetical protein
MHTLELNTSHCCHYLTAVTMQSSAASTATAATAAISQHSANTVIITTTATVHVTTVPTVTTAVAQAAGMLRKLQRSLTLLAELRVAGCVPDQYTYTSALNACTTAGDAPAAVALLKDLVARAAEHGSSSSQGGPAPDGYAYGSAMNACSKVRILLQLLCFYVTLRVEQ